MCGCHLLWSSVGNSTPKTAEQILNIDTLDEGIFEEEGSPDIQPGTPPQEPGLCRVCPQGWSPAGTLCEHLCPGPFASPGAGGRGRIMALKSTKLYDHIASERANSSFSLHS